MDQTGELRRKERLGYIVLQHVHTFSGEASIALLPDAIAASLAITPEETREILGMLAGQGYVVWNGPAGGASLTSEGEDYLLRRAARRKSVRFRWIVKPEASEAGEDHRSSREAHANQQERRSAEPAPNRRGKPG